MKRSKLKEYIKSILVESPDFVNALYLSTRGNDKNRGVSAHWTDGGVPFVFSKKSKKCYVGKLESTHGGILSAYRDAIGRGKYDANNVDLNDIPEKRSDPNSLWGGRIWPGKRIMTFWNYPDRHNMITVIKKIEDEYKLRYDQDINLRKFAIEVLLDAKRKDADPYMKGTTTQNNINNTPTVVVPMEWYLSGKQITVPKHGRMKKDKLLQLGYAAAAKNQDVAHILSPVLKKRKSFDNATKDALMAYYKKQDKYTPEDKNFIALLRTLG